MVRRAAANNLGVSFAATKNLRYEITLNPISQKLIKVVGKEHVIAEMLPLFNLISQDDQVRRVLSLKHIVFTNRINAGFRSSLGCGRFDCHCGAVDTGGKRGARPPGPQNNVLGQVVESEVHGCGQIRFGRPHCLRKPLHALILASLSHLTA